MNLNEVKDDMEVRITAGGSGHPLHGHRALVILVDSPLPDSPPASLRDSSMAQITHRISSNMPDDRDARAYRRETLEQPFAFPHGRVHLSLLPYTVAQGRRWPFPYIVVGPEDIEAV